MFTAKRCLGLCLCGIAGLSVGVARGDLELGENFLIPIAYPRDNAFDLQRGILYASQENGTEVLRYDVSNQTWLSPMGLSVGETYPCGLDITPDGHWLYVATWTPGDHYTAYLGKCDLDTGVDHGFTYSTGYYEGDGYDIAMTSNGKAFLTSGGLSRLREIDLATDTVSARPDAPGSWPGGWLRDRSGLFPSADQDTLFVWEGNISSGPGFVYDAIDDSFGEPRNLNTGWTAGASVNRNGTLISTPVASNPMGPLIIRDRWLDVVRDLGLSNGAQFDPIHDCLYVLDTEIDQIVAYNSNTWSEIFRFPVGEPINDGRYFQEGHMTVSPDGQYLFMNTDSGIRVYGIPEPATASLLVTAGLVASLVGRRRARPPSVRHSS